MLYLFLYLLLYNLIAELAEIIDVTTQYMCRIETRNPKIQYSVGLLGKIADALDVDIKDLFVDQKKK